MMKFRALNQESSDESEGEEEAPAVTREAQEQEAFHLYQTALLSLRKKKFDEAKSILRNILDGDVLPSVNAEEHNGHPLAVLKYSCLKNMGSVLIQQRDYSGALNHFIQAAKLDSNDVMLWYNIGIVASKLNQLELSRDSYLEAINLSPNNWECLNNLIMVLYVLKDYLLCLVFISRCFDLDPSFIRGHVIRDAILEEEPHILTSTYLEELDLGKRDLKYDEKYKKEILNEAVELRKVKRKRSENFVLTPVPLEEPVKTKTWLSLGKSLLVQRRKQQVSLVSRLDLFHKRERRESNKEEGVTDRNEELCVDVPIEENVPGPANDCVIPSEEVVDCVQDDDFKGRKRRRSSLSYVPQWVWGGKRRSARVRSTVRREAEREECNLEETLQRIFPHSVYPSSEKMKEGNFAFSCSPEKPRETDNLKANDDSMDTMDLYKLFENREAAEGREEKNSERRAESDCALKNEGYFGTLKEDYDVERFMDIHNYLDIIDLLDFYLRELSSRWNLTWPNELIYVYIEVYKLMRTHVSFPDICSETLDWMAKEGYLTVLYEELSLDCWLKEKLNDKKKGRPVENRSVPLESIGYLERLSTRLPTDNLLRTRMHWLKVHCYLNEGNLEMATGCLCQLIKHFEFVNESEKFVTLTNCFHNNVISKDTVRQLLTALFRNQNLCEVQFLYEAREFEQMVEILQETFSCNQYLGVDYNNPGEDCPDRATQLEYLMDGLWELKRYEECFTWGEACCNEALQKYLTSEDDEQQRWAIILEKLLVRMEWCVRKTGLTTLDIARLTRLVSNLIRIVCHQLDAPDNLISMPIECVSPWILFQQILEREDQKGTSVLPDDDDDLPAYINILFLAHEFLSRRSWCCSNEGALLLHTMDVVIPRMHKVENQAVYNKMVQGMEQVIFCLYSLPNKKIKLKGPLQDHRVPSVKLTWEHAIKLFQFYLPRELPEFDSLRAVSITADVEVVLKKIIDLVPDECNPVMMVDKMNQFVEGRLSHLPKVETTTGSYIPLPRQISSIYYLLGDYYFKNNEWEKAIQHYLLDVCVNPVRLDSWAGMALARGSQLETKLNSCEVLKSEADFLRRAARVQRCFQQSLKIQPRHLTLWIEYGSFAYMVHSFCSRLLKQETESLSLEMFDLLEKQKEVMLKHAVDCFVAAVKIWYRAGENSGLQDERWLYHYMLGKTAEKYNKKPAIYLDHYLKSCHFLHINGANYSRKISYNNPQNFSVEALEVFYRVHACILKWFEQNEGKPVDPQTYVVFQRCLQAVQQGPFMSRKDLEGYQGVEEDKFGIIVQGKGILSTQDKEGLREGGNRTLEEIIRDVTMTSNEFLNKVENDPALCKTGTKSSTVEEETDSDDSDENDSTASESSLSGPQNLGREDQKREICAVGEIKNNIKGNQRKENTKTGDLPEVASTSKDEIVSNHQSSEESDNENSSMSQEGEDCKEEMKKDDQNLDINLKSVQPEDVTAVRRSSQESATTATTETSGGNSSSSSDDSSSSEESSESDSSSSDSSDDDSDGSQSTDATGGAPSKNIEKEASPSVELNDTLVPLDLGEKDWKKVSEELIHCCIVGLEECVLRFPQHYKSLYRLTHYFFRSKSHKNLEKCRDLLLGIYKCSFLPHRPFGASFQGLFAERKNNNFFNGVWRIPVSEVDRAGNFASHMSRCVSLLMDVLRERKDHGLLLELCVQLRRTPDPDKKYLRDSEREQLSRQAFSLAVQTLRNCAQNGGISSVLDVYESYQRAQKHFPQKESVFSAILIDAYKKHTQEKKTDLEQITQYCQQELAYKRWSSVQPSGGVSSGSASDTSLAGFPDATALLTSMILKSSALPTAHSVPGSRPRGRPPNALKYAHLLEDRSMNWTDTLSRGLLQQQQLLLLQQQKQLQFYQEQNELQQQQLYQQMQYKGQQQQLKELQQMRDRQQQHLRDHLQQQTVDQRCRDQQFNTDKQYVKELQSQQLKEQFAQQLLQQQVKDLEQRYHPKESIQSKDTNKHGQQIRHQHQQIRDQVQLQQHIQQTFLHQPEQQQHSQQNLGQNEQLKETLPTLSRNEKHQISLKKESKELVREKLLHTQQEDKDYKSTSTELLRQQPQHQEQEKKEQHPQPEKQRQHEHQPLQLQEQEALQQNKRQPQQERQPLPQQDRPPLQQQELQPLQLQEHQPLQLQEHQPLQLQEQEALQQNKRQLQQERQPPPQQERQTLPQQDRQPLQQQERQPLHQQERQPLHQQERQPLHQQERQPLHQQERQPLHQQERQPLHQQERQPLQLHEQDALQQNKRQPQLQERQPLSQKDRQPLQQQERQPLQQQERQPLQQQERQPLQQQERPPLQQQERQPLQQQERQPLQKQERQPLQKQELQPLQKQELQPLQKQELQPLQKQELQPLQKQELQPLQNQELQPLQNQELQPLQNQELQPLQNQELQPLQNQELQPLQNQELQPLQKQELQPLQQQEQQPLLQQTLPQQERLPQQGRQLLPEQELQTLPKQEQEEQQSLQHEQPKQEHGRTQQQHQGQMQLGGEQLLQHPGQPQEQQKQHEHQKEQPLHEQHSHEQQQKKEEEQQHILVQPLGQSLPQSLSKLQQKLHSTLKDRKRTQQFPEHQQMLKRRELHKKKQELIYPTQKQEQHPLFKESTDNQQDLPKQLPQASHEKTQHYHSQQIHSHMQQKQASALLSQQQTLMQSPPKISQKNQGSVPDFSSLSSLLSDPNILSAMKGKMFPGVDAQLVFELYKAQLTQSTFQTEFIRQLAAHNLSLPQITPSLFSSLPNLPFANTQLTGSNFKLDSDHPSTQASNVMSDYVKDRPSISITPINQSNSSNKSKPVISSSSSASMSASYVTSSQEKTRSASSFVPSAAQSTSTSVKDSKYFGHESFSGASYKAKDLMLGSGSLTISPSTTLVNVPVSKSNSYRKPIQSQGLMSKTDESVRTISSSSPDNKSFSNPMMSKVEHKAVISSSQRHGNSDSTVSSHGDSLSIFSQRSKTKDLQIIPMTSGENPLSIHPLPSNYKQSVNYPTDSSTRQDDELENDINYSPPVKKMKDSLSIVEVPRIVSPTKKQFDLNKKEELKTPVEADVEIITLE